MQFELIKSCSNLWNNIFFFFFIFPRQAWDKPILLFNIHCCINIYLIIQSFINQDHWIICEKKNYYEFKILFHKLRKKCLSKYIERRITNIWEKWWLALLNLNYNAICNLNLKICYMKYNRDYYLKWNRESSSQNQFKIVWNFINEIFLNGKLKIRKEQN